MFVSQSLWFIVRLVVKHLPRRHSGRSGFDGRLCRPVALLRAFSLLLIFLLAFCHAQAVELQQHPFMIVKESEYAAMRDLADDTSGIYGSMKTDAINYLNTTTYDPTASLRERLDTIADLTSKGSLAYILDPSNATTYLGKLKTTLNLWSNLESEYSASGGNVDEFVFKVRGGNAFLHSTLALDVIHNALSPSERSAIEAPMGNIATWFDKYAEYNWKPNAQATIGVWKTYKGDPSADSWNAAYRYEIERKINAGGTEGGIFASGIGYAWARMASDRSTKAYYMDVLDYIGKDDPNYESFYDDPKVVAFNEWLYGGTVTPLRKLPSFGDTGIVAQIGVVDKPDRQSMFGVAPFRAGRFSEQAAKNAAWGVEWFDENEDEFGLLYYRLRDPLPQAEVPKSRVWLSGYAAFREPLNSNRALAGYLWCPDYPDGTSTDHAHNDINALHLTGYGADLLLNSGYYGFETGISDPSWTQSYDWDWIHNSAKSGNTVLVNDWDHVEKKGGGVDEGFTNAKLDYACGNSGDALGYASHRRNFIFIRPTDNADGYWILFDEIESDYSWVRDTQVLLHPNAHTITTAAGNTEYIAKMDGMRGQGKDLTLSMFLGTEPTSVDIKKGGIACGQKTFEGEYLYSSYDIDASKKKNVVTVLFPYDRWHSKAQMTRISGNGYTGAEIQQGDVVDFAIESDGTSDLTHGDVMFRGLATMWRMDNDELDYYFVRKGRLFDDGQAVREGFVSDDDISLFMTEDGTGSIISPGTDVTFYSDNITGLFLDDILASVIALGEDWVKVMVPSGTWECQYRYVLVPGDANGDDVVDGSDVAILAGNWQAGVGVGGATWAMGDFNDDGAVDGSDIAILAGNWQFGVDGVDGVNSSKAVAVPEPGSMALIVTCLLAMGLVPTFHRNGRRRRY